MKINVNNGLLGVLTLVATFSMGVRANAFEALFVTSDKCASVDGKQLGIVFSSAQASGYVTAAYVDEVKKCVQTTNNNSDNCEKEIKTGDIRHVQTRIGTLEYVLIDPNTGSKQVLESGPITGWLAAQAPVESSQDWYDVSWSFVPTYSRLGTLILSSQKAGFQAWIFGNTGKGSDQPIASVLKSNSFKLVADGKGERIDGLGTSFSASLFQTMLKNQKDLQIHVTACSGRVTGVRK